MRRDDIEEAVELGRTNQRAIMLLKNHCGHARVELPNGTSMVGEMYDLPIGMADVRCEHARGSRTMAMQVMDLAVAFYERNCVDCPFRAPSGMLPTISTEVDRRRHEREAAKQRAEAEFRRAHDAWAERYRRRRTAVASAGYPARDLAAA